MSTAILPHSPVAPAEDQPAPPWHARPEHVALAVTIALAERVLALRQALHTIAWPSCLGDVGAAAQRARDAIDADDATAAREPTLPAEEIR